MNNETEFQGDAEQELIRVLEYLLAEDVPITARAVARLHPTLKAASSITRNTARSALLAKFQARQAEFRRWRSRSTKLSSSDSAATLAAKDSQISDLEANVQLLTASHVAMLRAVGELGGFAKWAQFYESYAMIRNKLSTLGESRF
ncbi:hypothetical protein [Pseudoduganella namucuonensis]|uniref:hypothetical protein n=1 Tax=Pseudoduganella namucuonensis TaxID=1035707 RepID=UPI000B826CD4|nr:hypothetical protein [Pseudoduganella namucuonensis]